MVEKSDPNVKILVACHKPVAHILENDIFMPIHVGKSLHPEVDLGFTTDSTGDNISDKNDSFCELTALYWAWKNLKNVDYIGLCHYRRYLNFTGEDPLKVNDFFEKFSSSSGTTELKKELNYLLDRYPVLIPKKDYCDESIYESYARDHHEKDLLNTFEIIRDNYDNSFVESFIKTANGNRITLCNMFVMPWETFCEYCEFLFHVLFELEKKTDLSNYDTYQKRIYGFIGERLLNVFLNRENAGFKTKEIPVLLTESPTKHNLFHYSPFCKRNRKYIFSKHKKLPVD